MLTGSERRSLELELANVLANNDPKAFIRTTFSTEGQPLLLKLPANIPMEPLEYAFKIVQFCLLSRWTMNPALLDLLLTRLIDMYGIGSLALLQKRVRSAIDPNPDPFASNLLLSQQPFFDRRDLRRHVKFIIEKNDRPVLRVNGPPGSGRHYTTKFLEFVREQNSSDLHLASAEIADEAGPSYQPDELADSLTSPMGLEEKVPGRTTSSYAGELSRWILRNAMRQSGMWIFVLEGFSQRDVKPEVTELVNLLVKGVSIGEYRRRLRVVLIDYSKPLLGIMPADIIDEIIPPSESISDNDIAECLVALNAWLKAQGHREMDPMGLPIIAEGILQSAPKKGKARLRFVYDQLMALASNEPR